MRRFALILVLWPGVLAADEFRQLTGDEILAALAGQKLDYGDGVWQSFDETMQTQYFSGRPNTGRWAVRDDQYCSIWPPSDFWACYDVQQSGDVVRFVDDSGGITVGIYVR
ncbi:hypothetical protein [Ruegeria lacuscaerulensis]|uniref:hypothetical protein n=1 Tax=Ruegeria lacuscaerulensis TaxID=55218 RepID=UPI00147B095E|nr:hypothetical protein [Ruegeria lacuscaerulensis]